MNLPKITPKLSFHKELQIPGLSIADCISALHQAVSYDIFHTCVSATEHLKDVEYFLQ